VTSDDVVLIRRKLQVGLLCYLLLFNEAFSVGTTYKRMAWGPTGVEQERTLKKAVVAHSKHHRGTCTEVLIIKYEKLQQQHTCMR
jgi:hypothetical protein